MPIGSDGKVVRKDGLRTPFQANNRYAARERRNPCTQALLSQLNEVDKKTNRAKIDLLCEALIKCAIGYTDTTEVIDKSDGKKKTVKVKFQPDVTAMAYIFDRVDGKPHQATSINSRQSVMVRSVEEIRADMAARGVVINGSSLEVLDLKGLEG